MSQKDIEVILMRQLAGYLAMPIFVVDSDGSLLFYNEPAEKILGLRFEETSEMSIDDLEQTFQPTDEQGEILPAEMVPVIAALREQKPFHRRIGILGADRKRHMIEATAFPLVGEGRKILGAVSIFWEANHPERAVQSV